jgi:DNA helicase-2/ATP-dependent DNA helicase PcrA
MTLHAAKGLEFPVVAIVGMEDGCLPHSRARDNNDDLEEERRLCYVGITRAQERLILSKASYRTIRGLRERTAPSQFLLQMPQEFLEITDRGGSQSRWDHATENRSGDSRSRYNRSGDDIHPPAWEEPTIVDMEFEVGQRVRHPGFGVGRIVEVSSAGANTRAVVEFQRFGRKTLIVEHANLTPA